MPDPAEWRAIVPELPVADVRRAQEYYRDVLGFQIAWIWDDSYGAVLNGEVQIFFAKSGGPRPVTCAYLFVDDADAIYARCRAAGADIVEEIGSRPWGMREFTVRDPDGHRLRIGHGEKTVDDIDRFRTEP